MRIKCNAPTYISRHLRLLVLFFFCHVICFANGQHITINVRDTRISLNVKKVPLKDVFVLIEQKTGISIGYNATAVNAGQLVNYKAESEMLSAVFQQLLKDYEGSVKQVDDRHIFLKVTKKKPVQSLVATPIASVQVVITGKVTDETNQPLPGVVVYEKTTRKSTTTDGDGKYSITVNDGDILVFNFIGYAPKEVVVNGQTSLDVKMKVQNSQLKEVVAIGYQSVRKSDVTGAIASVKASELNLTSPSVGQALVGKVAGVMVSQVSGAPYASTKIRVRGIGSANASTNPLYVIDGYPMENSNNDLFINPEDIASIDILKDAASAAIYGSRASGGVILITTKRGQEGKGKFEYDLQTGINQLAKKVKLLDADQFSQLMVDARNNSYHDFWVNGGNTWTDAMKSDDNATRVAKVNNANAVQIDPAFYDFANQKIIKSKYNTDWQDLLYRNAVFTRHNLSFSGGKDDVRYYISGGYQNQDGIILNTGVKKINLRANIDGKVNAKLKVGLNVSYTNNQNRETEEGRWDHNPIMAALLMLPTYRAYDDNGKIAKNEVAKLSSTYGYNSFENPLAIAKEINITRNGNRATYNAYAIYEILPALTFKVNLGVQSYSEKYNYYYPTSLSSGVSAPYSTDAKNAANAKAQNKTYLDKLGEYTLNYNKQIRKHKIDFLAGYTAQKSVTDFIDVRAKGFDNDRVQNVNGKGADAAYFTLNSATNTTTTLLSYLARVNYNYDGRYFLTASFRTDGSSRFGPQNKWGTFPSVAAGWSISDESFYHNWLGKGSTLKLRASWGLSGNNNIPDYAALQVMEKPTGTVFGNSVTNATYAGTIKDSKLGWESTSQYNGGLDIGLFNSRITVIANYYMSYSYNLLFNQSVSGISGTSSMLTNLRDSKIRNRGVDLQIDARVIDGKDFHLNFSGNISVNRNKVLDMGGASTIITAGAERSYKTHITQQGQPVGMFYGFKVLGVATEANYKTVAPSASSTNPIHPGDLYFYDKTGDGVVNDADKDVIGNPYPKFTYGFNLSATYKDFYLSSSFNGSKGNQVLDGQDYYLYNMEGSGNQYADVAEHFRSNTEPGNGHVFRPSRAGTQSNSTRLSTFYLQDASYFRCTNVILGYNFKFRFLKDRLGISKATLFASVDNAFTITKYKGYNPEVDFNVNSSTNSNLAPGVDYGMYPLVRAYNVGAKLAF